MTDNAAQSCLFTLDKGKVEVFERMDSKGATSLAYKVRIEGKEYFMKQLRPELRGDWRYRSVYQKEYEVGRRIRNEHIVTYESIGENEDGMYILMEHVNGRTLDEKLATEPEYFTRGRNFEKLFVQLLKGMKALHQAHVAYLDLKPDNVMLTQVNNDVKIVDLGFCFADAYSHTAGSTRAFSAPELSDGNTQKVDERTDIYAVGQLMQYVKDMACISISPHLQHVIKKCMQPNMQDRYANADEVMKAITWKRKWRRALLIIAAVVTAITAGYVQYSKTESYRTTLQLVKWGLRKPQYDIEYERNYYRILSEDSLTCMAVGGRRLENLYIHDKVYGNGKEYRTVAVEGEAFGGRHIRSVYIPDGIRYIGPNAFARCSKLLSVQLPASVEKIGDGCFEVLEDMKSLQLSANTKEIPLKAFVKCTSLEKVDIPEGVEVLGLDAFAICTALKRVSLPSTLTSIRRGVFWRCTNLKEITIPASVKTIGEYVFFDCDSLKHVYNHARVPQRIPRIFNTEGIILHVPHGSEELYRQADNWNVTEVVGDLP